MSLMPGSKSEKQVHENHAEWIRYTSEPPTLQHIAAVSVACMLWSEPDIKEGVSHHSEQCGYPGAIWFRGKEEFVERVRNKLADMNLPNPIKCKVSKILRPVELQLSKGFAKEDEFYERRAPAEYENEEHEFSIQFEVCFLFEHRELVPNKYKGYCPFYDIFKVGGSVYWTVEGIIDNVRSLKEVINNEDNGKDYYCLYELACKYCLEENIPDLWRKVSSGKKNGLDYIYDNYEYHIVAFWTASVESKLPSLLSKLKQSDIHNIYDTALNIEQNMISLSIFIKNEYSLRYFWNKLNELERNDNLVKWLGQALKALRKYKPYLSEYLECYDKINILWFLLSQLKDRNKQEEIFQAHSRTILKATFFYWPWQRFLVPTFSIMLGYISEDVFVEIMTLIAKEIDRDKTLIEVFREVWFQSSFKFKKSLIQSCMQSRNIGLIGRFLNVDDVESIFMILKYASAEESKQILFKMIDGCSYDLLDIILSNKLNLIDALVKKYLTIQDIKHFKNSLILKLAYDLRKDINSQEVKMLLAWVFESPSEGDPESRRISYTAHVKKFIFSGPFPRSLQRYLLKKF